MNVLVLGSGSKEITHIVHQVTDVTETVLLQRWSDEQQIVLQDRLSTLEEVKRALVARHDQLGLAHSKLTAIVSSRNATESTDDIRLGVAGPMTQRYFASGDRVPIAGIYLVHHLRDSLGVPRSVYLRGGARFPRYESCSEGFLFALGRAM